MRKLVNNLISMTIVFLVSGATLAMAANPIRLLERRDSNLTLFQVQRVCSENEHFRTDLEMIVDLASNNSAEADDIARQMIDEAINRHIKVSVISSEWQERCDVKRIDYLNNAERLIISDTHDYKHQTITDFVEVINTCRLNIEQKGKCLLLTTPEDFMSESKIDAEKYQYFLQTIKTLAI